jgi:hypothetical protein
MSTWRDEEYRGGADGKISASDRGKLGASEKEALAVQHRNRDSRDAGRGRSATGRAGRRCGDEDASALRRRE